MNVCDTIWFEIDDVNEALSLGQKQQLHDRRSSEHV
jgi:hypothetical protein